MQCPSSLGEYHRSGFIGPGDGKSKWRRPASGEGCHAAEEEMEVEVDGERERI